MKYNKKQNLFKSAMATGAIAGRFGNHECGAKKYSLVVIEGDNPYVKRIRDIKNKIEEAYSDDGGELYFLFSAENSYSSPMDTRDDSTSYKMQEELNIRKAFVESVKVSPMNEDALKEILIPIYAQRSSTPGKTFEEKLETIKMAASNAPVQKMLHNLNNQERSQVRAYITENPNEADPSRFSFDKAIFASKGYTLDPMFEEILNSKNASEYVYGNFRRFSIESPDHPVLKNKSEISILQNSIERVKSIAKEQKEYNLDQYIQNAIQKHPNGDKLKYFYDVMKKLGLSLQVPSWVAITWGAMGGTKPVKGRRPEDNLSPDVSLLDISFMDRESGYKIENIDPITKKQVANRGAQNPTTPQGSLIQIVGFEPRKKNEADQSKNFTTDSASNLLEKLRQQLSEATRPTSVAKLERRIDNLQPKVNLFNEIRHNIANVPHNSPDSFLYQYDEICKMYFNQTIERYGDAPMVRLSALRKNRDNNTISFSDTYKYENPKIPHGQNKPFMPTAKTEDLREVVISVHYAYGTETPQFAETQWYSNRRYGFSAEEAEMIVEFIKQRNIKIITIKEEKPVEVPLLSMPGLSVEDFLIRLQNNHVLVYRISSNKETGEFANLKWFVGAKSSQYKYDDVVITQREVIDEDGKTKIISGRGSGRPPLGTYGEMMSRVLSTEEDKKVNENEDDSGIFRAKSFDEVYAYAQEKYGLDVPREEIKSRMAHYIKPISHVIVDEFLDTEQNREIVKKIENAERKGDVVIPEQAESEIDKIIEEVRQSLANKPASTEQQPEAIQPAVMENTSPYITEQEKARAQNLWEAIVEKEISVPFDEELKNELEQAGYEFGPASIEGRYEIINFPDWFTSDKFTDMMSLF